MRLLVAIAALLVVASPVFAQQQVLNYCQTASGAWAPASPSNPCSTSSGPPAVAGFGTLAVSTSSVQMSTLTTGPSSAVWPTAPGLVYIVNSPVSSGLLYVCPLGGSCTTSNGIPIAAGGAYGFYKPSTAMTVIAASSATAVAQW